MPRIHIRPSQVGPRLAITICLFFEILLSNIFQKSQPPIMTPKPRPQAKSYFIWFSSYHLSQNKNRYLRIFLKDFSISLLQPSSYLRKFTKSLFFILSLHWFILKRLCSRQVPHVGSTPIALSWIFRPFLNLGNQSWEPGGIGWPATGGIDRGGAHYPPLRKLSKNPSRQSLVRE